MSGKNKKTVAVVVGTTARRYFRAFIGRSVSQAFDKLKLKAGILPNASVILKVNGSEVTAPETRKLRAGDLLEVLSRNDQS